MKLPRQIMFSDEEELTDEEKIKLLDKAISSGCTRLTVNNKNSAAISLYKKKGFKTTSTDGRIAVMELN